MSDDDEYLSEVRKHLKESVRFFSSAGRKDREIYVVDEFLSNLGIAFQAPELVHVEDDPPDVQFRDARFEVKEIMDKGRRRHTEYKARLEIARAATRAADLLEHAESRSITYTDISLLVESRLLELKDKYSPKVTTNLDILFYVNLVDVFSYAKTPLPPAASWEPFGFRSVSFVAGRLGGVLMASDAAPAFLRTGGVRVIRRPDYASGAGKKST